MTLILCIFYLLTLPPNVYTQSAEDVLVAGTIRLDNAGVEMVYVPQATFEVGVEQSTLRSVCVQLGETNVERCIKIVAEDTAATYVYVEQIQSFWMDRYEVSIEQFIATCTSNYIWFPFGCPERNLPVEFAEPLTKPQVGVTWFEANAFCNARDARLPSEAEWEYAASGPEKRVFPWGEEYIESNTSPVNPTNQAKSTYSVGSIPANRSWVGIYDLAGNAAEWTENRYLPRFIENNTDYIVPIPYHLEIARAVRGGSWDGRRWPMTTFYREPGQPQEWNLLYGFRCVRSSAPS